MRDISDFSLVFCLALSLTTARVRGDDAEVQAVEAVAKLGGTITRDEQADGKPVIAVSFEHTGITNAGQKDLKTLDHLQSRKNPRERR